MSVDPSRLPSEPESELYILAAAAFDDAAREPIFSAVTPHDFWKQPHRLAFAALLSMKADGTPITRETFAAAAHRALGDEQWNYLAASIEDYPLSTDHALHCKILKRSSAKRKLLLAADALQTALAGRAPLNGEWESVQDARTELEALETGRALSIPAVPISKLMEEPDIPPDYILKPFLTKGCLTVLQGTPKSGKSCFALYMALCSGIGVWIAGEPGSLSGAPRRTLFLSYEDPLRRIKNRARQYQLGLELGGYPDSLLVVRDQDRPFMDIGDVSGQKRIIQAVKEHQADCFMVDTLSFMRPGRDENSAEQMDPVMQGIRRVMMETGVSFMPIHHTRKGSVQGDDQASIAERARGSSVIAAAADIIIDWGNHDDRNLTLVQVLSKDDQVDPFQAHYDYNKDEDSVKWKLQTPELKKKVNTTHELIKKAIPALKSSGTSPTRLSISIKIGMSKDTVTKALKAMVLNQDVVELPGATDDTKLYELSPKK